MWQIEPASRSMISNFAVRVSPGVWLPVQMCGMQDSAGCSLGNNTKKKPTTMADRKCRISTRRSLRQPVAPVGIVS